MTLTSAAKKTKRKEIHHKDWKLSKIQSENLGHVHVHDCILISINPLIPGMFCKKCVFWWFWWFLGWISAKLPLTWLKKRLQHNSLPFLPPASRFSAQKSKFRLFDFWNFFSPFLFLLFSSFCCSDHLRLKNFWESVIEMGNFWHGAARCSDS